MGFCSSSRGFRGRDGDEKRWSDICLLEDEIFEPASGDLVWTSLLEVVEMDLRDVVLRDLCKVTYGVRVLDNLDRISGSLDAQETVSGSCASREHATDYAVLIGGDQ